MSEMPTESIREARSHFAELIDRADREAIATIITRRGKEVAAVVSIELLRQFQQWEEEWVNRVVDERMASAEPGIPLAEVLAETAARSE